jgi:hypothetical protein
VPTSPRNSAASGQLEANANLTRLAVSLIRTAILSNRSRMVEMNDFELDPWAPTVAASARMSPDIYGICSGQSPYGDGQWSPWGGACGSHYGQNGANIIDDPILSRLRLR